MTRKTTKFNRSRVRAKTEEIKKDGARWLLQHSVIFARLHANSQRKKGRFFAIKARLTRFYLDHVEPKISTLKTKTSQLKQWLAGRWTATKAKATEVKQQGRQWLTRRRRSLWLMAIVVTFVAVGVALAYLWQRSPAFRATVKTLGVATVSVLVTLWALLKGLGLSMREGLNGLGRGLASLGTGAFSFLRLLWNRLTKPIIEVIVVTNPTGDTVPVPPADGRL